MTTTTAATPHMLAAAGSSEEGAPVPKQKYPRSVFLIIGNEFCERFTYYGLRTVLTLYLTRNLLYSEDTATTIFHSFALLAYFSPLLGAIIADSWLGKFRTILYISILYAVGVGTLSVGSYPFSVQTMAIISIVGLVLIAFGTGGIKPCVSAFGGDQFKPGQEEHLQKFFSWFYMSINMGSVVSTGLTPYLREDVHCFGENSCFPLAFGVPGALMVVAIILFVAGKPLYVMRPPEGNIVLTVLRCICYAIGKKFKTVEKKKAHWLDYADDKFDKKLINDIKIVLRVLVLYIPLPFFWTLFDQQGSRWTLQATRMDGEIGKIHIKPDQMQILNPLLIILFIPVFDYAVYPFLKKCNFCTKPLQKMTIGGILAAISFGVAGFLELSLEKALPVLPAEGNSDLIVINNSPCPVSISGTLPSQSLDPFTDKTLLGFPIGTTHSWTIQADNCTIPAATNQFSFNSSEPIESMMITVADGTLQIVKGNDTKEKSKTGEPKIRIFFNIDPPGGSNITFKLYSKKYDKNYYISSEASETTYGTTPYGVIPPGNYKVFVPSSETEYDSTPILETRFISGGYYFVNVYAKSAENQKNSFIFNMVQGNSVSLLLQLPQYLIITFGEIMFSITGLEFSYSQAPVSMKSVLQASWLMTVAFGNLIVIIVAELSLFSRQSHEMFFFGSLMVVDMIAFAILAHFYTYQVIKNESSEQVPTSSSKGNTNDAYVEETDFNK